MNFAEVYYCEKCKSESIVYYLSKTINNVRCLGCKSKMIYKGNKKENK